MSSLGTARSAWQGVTANLMRSVLTMLGILIGVAAVIVLVAVGNGSAKAVSDSISSLGTSTLSISAGRGTSTFTLTDAMVDALEDEHLAPDVESVSPVVQSSATAAAGQSSTTISQVVGTTPAYLEASSSQVAAGSMFDAADVESVAKVVVLGQAPAEDLFGSARSALGQDVLLGSTRFTVVGVLEDTGSSGPGGGSATALAPISTVRASLAGYGGLSSILVQATSDDTVAAAQAQAETVLNALGKVTDTSSLPYSVQDQSSLLETQEESSRTFTILLGVVAGISLLVGGLGITNIMLVTVTERTREIGVRKALGAPRRTILGQFLVESIMLSLTGGVLGVLVALAVSRFTILGVVPVVVPASVALALGICLVIGVLFGSLPANRAAGLRPVEALRHE